MRAFHDLPEAPESFATDVAEHHAALHDLAADEDWEAVKRYLKAHPSWGSLAYKAVLATHHHRKCAYCERLVTDYGDVEHFRPKGAIYALKTAGSEREGLNNVRGRTFHKPPREGTWTSGYWWLAYDWSNYLLSCGRCNQQWKNALFPVAGGHTTRPSPEEEAEPLLLHPWHDRETLHLHLHFRPAGAVTGLTERGRQTILVLGLDRPSLTQARLPSASRTSRVLDDLENRVETDPTLESEASVRDLEELAFLGNPRHAHAGMVRVLVRQRLELGWDDLQSLLEP